MYLQASKYARKPVSTTKLHKEKKNNWKKFKAILHPWKKQMDEAQVILKLHCMSVRSLFYTYNHSRMPKRLKIAMMLSMEDKGDKYNISQMDTKKCLWHQSFFVGQIHTHFLLLTFYVLQCLNCCINGSILPRRMIF